METKFIKKRITPNPIPVNNPFLTFVESFVRGNFFYILSALFMLLGCFLLMNSSITGGGIFMHKMKTLLLLQGYEALVILTAAVIVKKLKFLGDAYTLLIIELALLLDPTFFSNSFFTMQDIYGKGVIFVNAACFALMILKLLILCSFLKIKLHFRAFAGFVFAGIITYLLEEPLTRNNFFLNPLSYFYLMAWMPALLCCILPALSVSSGIKSPEQSYITDKQKKSFPWILMLLPLAIAVLHFFETGLVHQFEVRLFYFAPLLLTIPILVTKNIKSDKITDGLFITDFISFIAMIFSIPALNAEGKMAAAKNFLHSSRRLTVPSELLDNHVTIIASAAAIVFLYLYFYFKHKHAKALLRIVFIAVAAILYGVLRTGFPGKVMKSFIDLLAVTAKYFWANPLLLQIMIFGILLYLAVRFKKAFTWSVFGLFTLSVVFSRLPIDHRNFVPEFFEFILVYLLIIFHIFKVENSAKYFCAAILAAIGFGRFVDSKDILAFSIFAVQVFSFFYLGIKRKFAGYIVIGILQGAAISFYICSANFALLVITAALILFGAGIAVTFQKEKLLGYLAKQNQSFLRNAESEDKTAENDSDNKPEQNKNGQ